MADRQRSVTTLIEEVPTRGVTHRVSVSLPKATAHFQPHSSEAAVPLGIPAILAAVIWVRRERSSWGLSRQMAYSLGSSASASAVKQAWALRAADAVRG